MSPGPPPPPPPPASALPGPPPPPPDLPPCPPPAKISPAKLHRHLECGQLTPEASLQQALDRFMKLNPNYSNHKFMCMNKHTVAKLQDGPQCGIVALVMSGSEKFQVQEVQDLAINKGFTNKGEMFSVENMADLANSALNKEVSIEPISKIADSRWLVECFSLNQTLLVPYDCGHNHAPAEFRGKKAHWGLITGIVVPITDQDICNLGIVNTQSNIHILGQNNKQLFLDLIRTCKHFLIARQSKSAVLGIWETVELLKSNQNIENIDFQKENEYVIPDGGVKAGLQGKFVLLN